MEAREVKQEFRKQLRALGFDREKDPTTRAEVYIQLGPILCKKSLVMAVSLDAETMEITVKCDNVVFRDAVYTLADVADRSIKEVFDDFFLPQGRVIDCHAGHCDLVKIDYLCIASKS